MKYKLKNKKMNENEVPPLFYRSTGPPTNIQSTSTRVAVLSSLGRNQNVVIGMDQSLATKLCSPIRQVT